MKPVFNINSAFESFDHYDKTVKQRTKLFYERSPFYSFSMPAVISDLDEQELVSETVMRMIFPKATVSDDNYRKHARKMGTDTYLPADDDLIEYLFEYTNLIQLSLLRNDPEYLKSNDIFSQREIWITPSEDIVKLCPAYPSSANWVNVRHSLNSSEKLCQKAKIKILIVV